MTGSVLICGARSGLHPLRIRSEHPFCALTVHTYDCHQARKIREDLSTAGIQDIEVLCAPYLPEGRFWDAGFFFRDDKLMSAEFQLDCAQDMLAHLHRGAKAPVEGLDAPTRRKVTERMRNFSATWEASVPGGPKCTFETLPGCFCHRRPDIGGLALAEVAARAVQTQDRILDMGCGCGFVGLLVAERAEGASLLGIDSHTRAILAATHNAARCDVEAQFRLSDTGIEENEKGTFDLFLGNPPYYGNWSIAELFVRTAFDALKSGGRCYTVARNLEGLRRVQESVFPSVTVIPRRGYSVLESIRP